EHPARRVKRPRNAAVAIQFANVADIDESDVRIILELHRVGNGNRLDFGVGLGDQLLDPFFDFRRHRHFPLYTGLRFSIKARGPSRSSSDNITGRATSFSIVKPSSSGRPPTRSTPSLKPRTAIGPFAAIASASSSAFAINCDARTT